ncbi:nuclear transport factor 2 [Cladochytrium replicatum]|nr:nuclear transport factor 2 [Cladochytrium replicatum]KAI8808210.1 nuclear transport factor 2 [Cladochytrium replicatum]
MDPNAVATEFTKYYYGLFDTDRKQLQPLYRDFSMLTFEGASILGTAGILEKLVSLPFERVQHKIDTLDVQPSNPQVPNALLVFVTGQLLVDQEANPLKFTQTFQLIPEGNSFFIYNDIFRLNYG